MKELISFALLGLGPGALIAGIAIAVVLQYRGGGVINLAAGATAMFGAYVFYGLRTGGYLFSPLPFPPDKFDLGGPWALAPALVVTLVICAVFGIVLELALFGPLRRTSALTKLVASLGVMLYLQSLIVLRFGGEGQAGPPVLPQGSGDVVTVFGSPIPSDRLILAGLVVATTVVLMAIYRYTRFGVQTRAAAERDTIAMLAGLSPGRTSLINTVTATVIAGGLGVLVAPTSQLDSVTMTYAIIPALAASLFARFTSFPIAAGAGLAMGIIQSELIYLQSASWFPTINDSYVPGVADLLFFIIVTIALVARGAKLPRRGALAERRLPPSPRPRRIARPTAVWTAIPAVMLLVLPFAYRQALTVTFLGILISLSLVVIAGYVGQISLAQTALAGVSGYALYHLITQTGIGTLGASALAILTATVLGVAVGLPALRVRGVSLAIVTLAAAVALERFVFNNASWGGDVASAKLTQPHIFGLNIGSSANFPGWDGNIPSPVFGLVCLFVVAALCAAVSLLRRSRLGQEMLAVRSNERAAAAAGIRVYSVKLLGFAISSFIAATAGVLMAFDTGTIAAAQFGAAGGLAYVAYAYIGGITAVRGAVVAGLIIPDGILSYVGEEVIHVPVSYQLILGALALMATVLYFPEGLALAPARKHPPVRAALYLRRRLRSRQPGAGAAQVDAPKPSPRQS